MSFVTERYFQILENHNLYHRIKDEHSLRFFVEHHFICAWTYNVILRSIHQELVGLIHPLNTQSQKEAIRLVSEMMVEETVEEQSDGTLLSLLEIYLEAMQDLGSNLSPIVTFFDRQDLGDSWISALKQARFPAIVSRYARKMQQLAEGSLHQRAAALFYEAEPYVPDEFLVSLGQLGNSAKVGRLLDYFERRIEGIKRPGYSACGRLVEILCADDEHLSKEAELAAELTMKNRIEFWNFLSDKMKCLPDLVAPKIKAPVLRLIVSDAI